MKAVIYKKYASPDVLVPTKLEKPAPEASEVLIRVFATTVTKQHGTTSGMAIQPSVTNSKGQ